MNKTKIDWCDSSWNPVTGCLHGCEYCYARGIAKRFSGWGYTPGMIRMNTVEDRTFIAPIKSYYGLATETRFGKIAEIEYPFLKDNTDKSPYPFGFTPTFHRYRLNDYIDKKGRNIFVCSMADLFGNWVPDSWIEEVFSACEKAPQHNYLFLTKNPFRYAQLANKGKLPNNENMWYGFSYTGKGEHETGWWNPDYNIFVSMEPLLEAIEPPPAKWIIIGAETGIRKNKIIPKREWIEKIVYECRKDKVPVFMKSSLTNVWKDELIQEYPWKNGIANA